MRRFPHATVTARIAVLLIAGCVMGSCTDDDSLRLHKNSRLLMGTLVEITLVGERIQTKKAFNAVVQEIQRVEDLTSFHRTDSALSRLNSEAGKGPTHTDPELFRLIDKSLMFAKETDGAFDPTLGPLTRLWDFSGEKPRLPDSEQISAALRHVGWQKVKLDRQSQTVTLPIRGMALDLGAIAKGYALDRASAVIKKHGITSALVNAGGDILAVGEKLPGQPWRIGVQDPDNPQGIRAVVPLKDRVIVTSGDYERFFREGDVLYHHILDPRSGYPARGLRSVTILAPDGMTADALATAVFVLGPRKGMRKIESLPKVEGFIIDRTGKVRESPGAKSLFEFAR